MAWQQNYGGYSPDIKDIRSEPNSVPVLLMSMTMEIFRDIPNLMVTGKLSIYNLLAFKGRLRVMHSLTRTRSHIYYNQDYRELQKKVIALEKDAQFWGDNNRDYFLKYFDLLMQWFDLEVTLFEKFNLIPAEDVELEWPEIPLKELGLEKYV